MAFTFHHINIKAFLYKNSLFLLTSSKKCPLRHETFINKSRVWTAFQRCAQGVKCAQWKFLSKNGSKMHQKWFRIIQNKFTKNQNLLDFFPPCPRQERKSLKSLNDAYCQAKVIRIFCINQKWGQIEKYDFFSRIYIKFLHLLRRVCKHENLRGHWTLYRMCIWPNLLIGDLFPQQEVAFKIFLAHYLMILRPRKQLQTSLS